MKIIEVLKFFKEFPNSNSNSIALNFNITKVDASVRICKLYKSNLIKRTNNNIPYEYEITRFGFNYLRYKQENPGKRKSWHGLMPEDKR